ncbi:MAG: hypothetical protein ACREOB_05395 [Thermodesulfobacteriota bacterium]
MGTTTTGSKGLIKPDGNEPASNWPTQWSSGADILDLTINKIQVDVFTANGTWNKPAGTKYAIARVQAGGGGSGGTAATTVTQGAQAGGGGGGGYTEKLFAESVLGATETVVVGAAGTGGTAGANNGAVGGTSSFDVLSAVGGGGGIGSVATAGDLTSAGGSGGASSGGDLNINGGDGGSSLVRSALLYGNPFGGASFLGQSRQSGPSNFSAIASYLYGSGGRGSSSGASEVAKAGSAGAAGLIVVVSYISSAS